MTTKTRLARAEKQAWERGQEMVKASMQVIFDHITPEERDAMGGLFWGTDVNPEHSHAVAHDLLMANKGRLREIVNGVAVRIEAEGGHPVWLPWERETCEV